MEKHVLFVDDDADIRNVTKIGLETFGGWSVSLADSGSTALVMAARLKPDIILVDFHMPQMNGWEFLEELEKDKSVSGIPVVLYTADPRASVERANSARSVLVLPKPLLPESLGATLDAIYLSNNPAPISS